MSLYPVESESGRERAAELLQLLDRIFARHLAAYLKSAFARDFDLDIVAFFQIERLHQRGRKADGQTVAQRDTCMSVPPVPLPQAWIYVGSIVYPDGRLTATAWG